MLFIAAAPPATAADLGGAPPLKTELPPPPPPSAWRFSMTAYGWLSWVKGDETVKGRTVGVDASPKDLINALDWGGGLPIWMSYVEARNGKLSLFNDVIYSKLSAGGAFAKSRTGQLTTLSLAGSLDAEYKQTTIELGAAYEVWSNGMGLAPGATAIDLLAGIRYWRQNLDLSADLAATLAANGGLIPGLAISGGRVFARSGTIDWVDPMIGARLRYATAPGQHLTLRADVGGFGAGSEFTWHAIATYDWRLYTSASHSIDAYFGYKALYVDYVKGQGTSRYEYDILQHGPVTGLTVRF
jgi:hypothetical protein